MIFQSSKPKKSGTDVPCLHFHEQLHPWPASVSNKLWCKEVGSDALKPSLIFIYNMLLLNSSDENHHALMHWSYPIKLWVRPQFHESISSFHNVNHIKSRHYYCGEALKKILVVMISFGEMWITRLHEIHTMKEQIYFNFKFDICTGENVNLPFVPSTYEPKHPKFKNPYTFISIRFFYHIESVPNWLPHPLDLWA